MAKKTFKQNRRAVARLISRVLRHPETPLAIFVVICDELGERSRFIGDDSPKGIEKCLRDFPRNKDLD